MKKSSLRHAETEARFSPKKHNKDKKVLGIPENQKIGAVIPMGYPLDGELKAPPRKETSELITFI